MKHSSLIILIVLLLAACGPSAEQMTATAIMAQAQTQTAAPTLTPIPTSTATLVPKSTEIPAELIQGVEIQYGTYDGVRYTSPNGNFTCAFGDPTYGLGAFDPVLTDESSDHWGQVYKYDIWGEDYGVFYSKTTSLDDKTVLSLLQDSKTHKEGLGQMLDNIFENQISEYAGGEELHREFVNDEILYGVVTILDNQSFSQPESRKQSFYLFTKGEYFYLVNYYTMIGQDESVSEMKTKLDEFYKGCEFNE